MPIAKKSKKTSCVYLVYNRSYASLSIWSLTGSSRQQQRQQQVFENNGNRPPLDSQLSKVIDLGAK